MYKKDYVLSDVDYLTLDVLDSIEYQNALNTDILKDLTFNIPIGFYSSIVVNPPMFCTVEIINGINENSGNSFKATIIRYKNGSNNNFSTSGYPVIGYASYGASNTAFIKGVGAIIVNDKPPVIQIQFTDGAGAGVLKSTMDGFIFTLKFCYYEKNYIEDII